MAPPAIAQYKPSEEVKQYFSAPEKDKREKPWTEWYEEAKEATQQENGRDVLTVNEETHKSKGDHVAA